MSSAGQASNFATEPGATVAAEPDQMPFYDQPYDGRGSEGPSSKLQDGQQQLDREVADDFDLNATITRVRARGVSGSFNSPPPTYYGVYVRFYEGASGTPGALQAEHYLPQGSPGVVYDAARPTTFDITLPTPFNANGRHFLSVQPVFGGAESWAVLSSGYQNVRGSVLVKRDRLAGGAWTVAGIAGYQHDMAFQLFGTLLSAPRIDAVSPNPAPRSGLVRITGNYFGPAPDSSRLTIDGKQPQYIAYWSDNLIIAYVPETSALGDVPVSITSSGKTGNATLNVTTRPAAGRIRWQFTVAAGHVPRRSAVGPDGTVYVNDVLGRLYALTPDGGLKWVFQAGFVAASGPVTVGMDGTIYVGGLVPKNPSTTCQGNPVNVEGIFAVNPDGTQKWLFDKTCDNLLSGPNVGPDGKIHAVTEVFGLGAFALNPDGTLAHAPTGRFGVDGSSGTEIVFGPAAPGQAPTQKYFQYESGGLYGYTLAGQQVFLYPTNAVGITQPVVGQRTGTVYTMPDHQTAGRLFAVSPQGALRWVSPIHPISNLSIPDAPPSESAVYVVQDGAKLHRVNPEDGSVVWTFNDNNEQLFDPIASPDDRLILMGGQANYGQPGFFEAVSSDGRRLWKQLLPDEPGLAPYGQVVPRYRARFTDDGQTAYIAAHASGADYSGRPPYSFFYALDTSDNTAPINQPPTATIVSPLSNLNVPARTQLDFKVRAEDDVAVARVEFFYGQNGTRTHLGTDTTADADGLYGTQFTPPVPGVYSLFAQVYDAAGLRGDSQSVTITASNQSPTISWISPANNAIFVAPASITLTARAADSDGTVTVVHFNSSLLGDIGQDTTPDAGGNYEIVWSNPPQGTHELVAWATDNDGTRRAATINVTINPVATPTPTPTPSPTPAGAPPVVSITSPADRASFAPGTSVAVTADASDSDGRVTRVEFWYEGSGNPAASDTTAPFIGQIRWPGATALKLYAVAYDDAGNRTESARVLLYFEDPAGNLTITGRITHQQSSPSNPIYLPNALVKLGLNNQPLRATRTDANGYYTFAGLSRGGGYKVEPAEPGYVFYPPAVFYSGLVENATRDFIAEGALPAGPTPTPTPGASGLAWERFYNSPHNAGDGGALVATDAQGNTYVAGTSDAGAGGDLNISLVKYAPDGTQLWEREYAGSGDGKDWATAIRVDSEGSVYVSGTTWGGAVYEYDVVTIKYAADGTRLWARTYNGLLGRWDTSAAMEIDNAGNVIVGGYSQAGDTSGRLYDEFIVIKYNPSGVAVWERRHSTDAKGDRLVALAVDSARNVYATGNAQVASTGGSTFEDIVTVKYAPDGARLWASRFNRAASTVQLPDPLPNNPASRAHAGGVGLDPATGDLYVFGTSEFGATGTDYLLLKYDPATGELRWNRNWSGTRADSARAMAVDAQGNAYLTGESYDGDFESATSVRSADVATVKFAPGGDVLWERAYRGFPGKTDEGRRIALDAAGAAYVAFYSEGFFNTDTGVIKYDADGAEQWVYRYDNPAHTSDQVSDLALDAAGNLYVAGSASVPNAAGAQTGDFVVFKLAPVSAALNAAPDVSANVQAAAKTGSSVTVAATATDRDGAVARVDFFDGTAQIGTDTAAPFSVEWSPAETGAHAITALATDDKGAARTSKTQIVTVGAALQTHAIAGRLTANGSPLAGATVALGGSHTAETRTDADGHYEFAGLAAGGAYTVTPTLAHYTFAPATLSFNNLSGNQTGNFTATRNTHTIAGQLRDEFNMPMTATRVTLSGSQSDTMVTDLNGVYSFDGLAAGGDYIVTPSKRFYSFNPASATFNNLSGTQVASFTGAANTVTISVRVTDASGNAIDGVHISVSGERNMGYELDASGRLVLRDILSAGMYTITPYKDGYTFNPSRLVFNNPETDQFANFVAVSYTAVVQFGAAYFTESEGGGRVTLNVTRIGNTAGTSTVAYATTDNPAAVRCDDNSTMSGAAFARCDYATSIDRITFAPGETSASFTIPLVDDSHTEHGESFEVVLSDPSGAALGGQPVARVIITDNDAANVPGTPNAIDNNEFFVRMHYLDFLNREPDEEGMEAWSRVLNNCAEGDTECDRNTVSSAFFRSQEFQMKGFYVYRFYKVALGRLPLYAEITPDMRSVSGQSAEEVYRKRAEFAEAFAARPAFREQYDALSDQAFIDTLLNRYNLTTITTHDPAEPEARRKLSFTSAQLFSLLSARTLSRAQVLRAIVQSDEVSAVEYNGAFVAMQYFGYLRRDPEAEGFKAWLAVLDANPEDYRTMVRGFESSVEYRLRFGKP